MKKFSNNEDKKQLMADWKIEMNSIDSWTIMLPSSFIIKIFWWEIFAKHRLLYFIVMTKNGMAIPIAWRDSCKQKKKFLVDRIQKHGWEV